MKLFTIRNSCGDPYLIRWTLFDLFGKKDEKDGKRRNGWSLKLHIILRSDDDRAPHDHPWTFLTLMLKGGYWEHRFSKVKGETIREWIAPGTLRLCRAPHAHRLELPEEEPVARPTDPALQNTIIEGFYSPKVRKMFRPAITLVFMWPRFREWGFYTPAGWIQWKEFLRNNARHDC